MNSPEHEKLWREILDSGEAADFRGASLARGLAFLRRRRLRRRLAETSLLAALLAAAVFGPARHRISVPPAAKLALGASSRAEMSRVEVISDEQLFALFPHRALALIGPRGHQELVFLDQGAAGAER